MRAVRCLLVAASNRCGRKLFGSNADRPMPKKTFALANMGTVFMAKVEHVNQKDSGIPAPARGLGKSRKGELQC